MYIMTAWATIAAIVVYFWTGMNAGRARVKFKIDAPTMEGPVEFMSYLRVQTNTLEQFPILLPSLWMCAYLLGDRYAAIGGAIWCVGRVVYAMAYYQAPSKRTAGFAITMLGNVLLFGGAVYGLVMH